jgi:hypothetical protein
MDRIAELDMMLQTASPDFRLKFAEAILSFKPGDEHIIAPMRKKISKTKRSKSVKTNHEVLAAKRPLNGWMAFRCWYLLIFSTWQQKEISGHLTKMWQADPFKGKWAIVAKAYSTIRDKAGKAQAPLSTYLQLVCPFIGIISPTEYMEVMGWTITDSETKEMIRSFAPDVSNFEERIRTTNLSVEDVVKYCEDAGYASGALSACKLTLNVQLSDMTLTITDGRSTTEVLSMATMGNNAVNINGKDNVIDTSQSDEDNIAAEDVTSFVDMEVNNLLLVASEDVFPFNAQFDPVDKSAGVGLFFDPNNGEAFESFDISTFVNAETFWNV